MAVDGTFCGSRHVIILFALFVIECDPSRCSSTHDLLRGRIHRFLFVVAIYQNFSSLPTGMVTTMVSVTGYTMYLPTWVACTWVEWVVCCDVDSVAVRCICRWRTSQRPASQPAVGRQCRHLCHRVCSRCGWHRRHRHLPRCQHSLSSSPVPRRPHWTCLTWRTVFIRDRSRDIAPPPGSVFRAPVW